VPGLAAAHTFEAILLGVAILLLAATLASKASSRLGVPALLLFLAIGMLAGSDGLGGIWFDDARAAQSLGTAALALILFAGGLSTPWNAVRPVLARGLSLATVGVAVTAALTGAFAAWLLNIGWREGLLLGSIVSSTDAAAVFGVLRSRGLRLKARLQPLLEFESGSNDPMAVFLTIALIELVARPETPWWTLAGWFALQMGVGAAAGWAGGLLGVRALNAIRLESEGLYPALTLGVGLATFSATALVGGSGFLAVYIAGVLMGRAEFVHKRSLIRFHDSLAWLMQIAMFLALGLLVFPSRLPAVALPGLWIALFLLFVARPLGVFLSLARSRLSWRHQLFVAWVGLRGAVPIVLATFPLLARMPQAELYFDIVFFIVLSSTLLQGTTLAWVARKLRLEAAAERRPAFPIEFVPGLRTGSEMWESTLPDASPAVGKRLVDLGLPRSALVVLIGRGENFAVPNGNTALEAGDTLLLVASRVDEARTLEILGARRDAEDDDADPPA